MKKRRPHKNSRSKAKLFDKIGERDKWTCQICGKPVMKLRIQNHPEAPSLDHIIPVCDGGTYVQENLRLTHLRCNNHDGRRHDPTYPKEKLNDNLRRSASSNRRRKRNN